MVNTFLTWCVIFVLFVFLFWCFGNSEWVPQCFFGGKTAALCASAQPTDESCESKPRQQSCKNPKQRAEKCWNVTLNWGSVQSWVIIVCDLATRVPFQPTRSHLLICLLALVPTNETHLWLLCINPIKWAQRPFPITSLLRRVNY